MYVLVIHLLGTFNTTTAGPLVDGYCCVLPDTKLQPRIRGSYFFLVGPGSCEKKSRLTQARTEPAAHISTSQFLVWTFFVYVWRAKRSMERAKHNVGFCDSGFVAEN